MRMIIFSNVNQAIQILQLNDVKLVREAVQTQRAVAAAVAQGIPEAAAALEEEGPEIHETGGHLVENNTENFWSNAFVMLKSSIGMGKETDEFYKGICAKRTLQGLSLIQPLSVSAILRLSKAFKKSHVNSLALTSDSSWDHGQCIQALLKENPQITVLCIYESQNMSLSNARFVLPIMNNRSFTRLYLQGYAVSQEDIRYSIALMCAHPILQIVFSVDKSPISRQQKRWLHSSALTKMGLGVDTVISVRDAVLKSYYENTNDIFLQQAQTLEKHIKTVIKESCIKYCIASMREKSKTLSEALYIPNAWRPNSRWHNEIVAGAIRLLPWALEQCVLNAIVMWKNERNLGAYIVTYYIGLTRPLNEDMIRHIRSFLMGERKIIHKAPPDISHKEDCLWIDNFREHAAQSIVVSNQRVLTYSLREHKASLGWMRAMWKERDRQKPQQGKNPGTWVVACPN